MRVHHRFFPVNGLRLHALEFGGVGRPIVLVHGEGSHGWLWTDVVAPLTLWGCVIAVDLRGHGDSQWSPTGDYGTTDLADDLAAVIEQLGEPADVVGLSWGGLVAVRLAARRPDLVRHLAVVEAPVDPAAGALPAHAAANRPYVFENTDAVLDWARRSHPGAAEPLVGLIAEHGVRPGTDGTLAGKFDRCFQQGWPFRAERYDDDWAAVSAPTLLVRGATSAVMPPAVFDAMLAARPEVTGVTVEGSGHLVPVECPMELADLLETFLRDDTIGLEDSFDADSVDAFLAYQPVSIGGR